MVGLTITAIISVILMIAVVLLVRYIAGKQISKIAFMLIWAIITIRLLVPIGWWQSELSIWNRIDSPLYFTQSNSLSIGNDLIRFLLLLWIGGIVVFGLYFFITHYRFRKNIRDALPVTRDYVLEWQKYNSTFRPIIIKQSDRISSPLTFGVFKPVIILPSIVELYEEEELKHILTHEYVHIRRFDYVSKLILAAVLCIHWFNPFVWLMYILANRDIELSCDEVVLKALDKKSSAQYAMTLIHAADSQNQLAMLYSGFAKHALEERVQAILDVRKKSNLSAVVAISLTLITILLLAEPVVARINYRLGFTEAGNLIINYREFDLDEYRNENGTSIIDLREQN